MKVFKNLAVLVLVFQCFSIAYSQTVFEEFKGVLKDAVTNEALELVNLTVKNTNISTVTNSDGKFAIKIPQENLDGLLVISYLGYQTQELKIRDLKPEGNSLKLSPQVTELSQINISTFKNAEALVRKVFKNRADNNHDFSVLMTAFYRETIKKRNKNVSLTEAVVNLHKQPYTSSNRDDIEIRKARKTTDYKRLDTLAVKLRGGPFSNIFIDIMKYPEYIFSDEYIADYDYSFNESSSINGRPVYVIDFKLKPGLNYVGYYGQLYIDEKSIALVRADYQLDVSNKKLVRNFLVDKKPADVVAYPTMAKYHVDYKETNGKWYYSYSSVDLTFKINKKRQLFNSVYTISSEMAITDWTLLKEKISFDPKKRLKPNVIITDAISGFSDPDFWGEYNLIEPEKSIESAINKIKRKLRRSSSNRGTSRP